jgi:predicted dehydrogenase
MKQLLQNLRTGETFIAEIPIPTPKPGTALIRTAASLVSAGTERMVVDFAQKSLVGKARSRPDLVRQVLDKSRREGLLTTVDAAFNRLDQPMPLGYSSAGTIVALGGGMEGFKVGQRVACAGGGYANHAEYALVPKNLLAPLDDHVSFENAAFTTLGAIAMHGFRLASVQVGARVGVIGLGLLGLLTVSIARAAGCAVFGVDLDPERVALAESMGATAVSRPEAERAAQTFTNGQGVDAVLICADTASDDPIELAGEIARDRAVVVAVGAVGLNIPRRTYFAKELTFLNSRSYGPGRYDPDYEEGGQDYPLGYVRWTEGRNMQSFADLLADGRIDVSPIITHRFPIEDSPSAYDLITGKTDEKFLGVLLTYPTEAVDAESLSRRVTNPSASRGVATVSLGVLGAGNFATAVMLPALKKNSDVHLAGIASASGLSAQAAAQKYGIGYATSAANEIFADPNINTVAILTRHDLHAAQVLAALEAGKHVFVEKPLTLNADELAQVETALGSPDDNARPMLTAGYNRRFAPLARKLKAFIDGRNEPLYAQYRVNAGYIPLTHWLHDPDIGGGRIIGEGVHFIDFLTYLVGDVPSAVSAVGLPNGGTYRDDNVQLTFTFPDGSIGTVMYLANGDKSVAKERVEVFAGGQVAVLDDYRRLETVANGKRTKEQSRLRQDKGHYAEWVAFADALKRGGEPPIPYSQLFGGMRAAFAAMDALRTGSNQQIPHS